MLSALPHFEVGVLLSYGLRKIKGGKALEDAYKSRRAIHGDIYLVKTENNGANYEIFFFVVLDI